MDASRPTLALIGGTGDLGTGLATRWVAAGYPVIIGSREVARAEQAAQRLAPPAGAPAPRGLANAAAAAAAEVVVITVPFASHGAILAEIRDAVAGKLVIDATVPLVPPKVARVQLPPDDSAAVAAQKALGQAARVVSAFHNVAALKLQKGEAIDCDVLVFGDKPEDREVAIRLAQDAGLRALHAGPLANSTAAEALTSVLIGINRNYKVDGAGIRITGIVSG
ncbi:MAG TPA: NADPH-dependent F420 reductase [Burkholderiales bacterium]|nr:NADPH-dependent F420 reductase [Burkholderiales bacterium]